MKALGIIRKLDDLGRVVIPMELRKTLQWNEGTPIQITATRGGILLQKYMVETDIQAAIHDLSQVKFPTDSGQMQYNDMLLKLRDLLKEVQA